MYSGSTTQVRKTNIKFNVCFFQKIKNDIYDNFDAENGIVSVVFATEFYIDLLNGLL